MGIDEYGMEENQYDDFGDIIYERIVDTLDCSSDVFSFIEKWSLNESSFDKEIYAISPGVAPKYYVEQKQRLDKSKLRSKDLVYKVFLNEVEGTNDYSLFVHALFDNLKQGKYEYFLWKDEIPFRFYGQSNQGKVEGENNSFDLRKAYNMSLGWEGCRGEDSIGIYPTAIINHGFFPIILDDNGYGDVYYLHDENGDMVYEQHIDSIYYRPQDVGAIEFIEDWYIHEKSGELHKKVKGCMLHFKALEGDKKVGLRTFAPQAVFIRFN